MQKTAHFLNVDLDIYSDSDLEPLVAAFGKKISVLYVGPVRKQQKAVLEIAGRTKNADATIRAFCKIIRALPRPARRLWKDAKRRDFSVGIQAMDEPNVCDFVLSAEAVQEAAALNARIIFSIYAPKMNPPEKAC